jgi:sterol desaturase/sphingolipid hydroxylase (fatty acid hydroxylase superfamily)
MNQEYPENSQVLHDAFFTTTASLCAGLIEIVLCHWWACGALAMDHSLWDRPLLTFLLAITITHWRIPHFWLIHRLMHPWRVSFLPFDGGKFLYKHVHSLHHKSSNPTAFSGTNMHPVESTLYYSAALLCLPFGAHPCIALACIIDCGVGAWLGHDGFQWPGSGMPFTLSFLISVIIIFHLIVFLFRLRLLVFIVFCFIMLMFRRLFSSTSPRSL